MKKEKIDGNSGVYAPSLYARISKMIPTKREKKLTAIAASTNQSSCHEDTRNAQGIKKKRIPVS